MLQQATVHVFPKFRKKLNILKERLLHISTTNRFEPKHLTVAKKKSKGNSHQHVQLKKIKLPLFESTSGKLEV